MMKVLWILTAIAAVLGGFVAAGGVAVAKGAPQEAAAAAIGLAIAVIPYCFARALSLAGDTATEQLKQVNATLVIHTKLLAPVANESVEREARRTQGDGVL